MASEWWMDGRRYQSKGRDLGPVPHPPLPRPSAPGKGPAGRSRGTSRSEDTPRWSHPARALAEGSGQPTAGTGRRVVVVNGSLDPANGSGCPLRLWGCRLRVTAESLLALKMVPPSEPYTVLLDLELPGCPGRRAAQRLPRKPPLQGAALIAVRGKGPEVDLLSDGAPAFEYHLVMTLSPCEVGELLAVVQKGKPAGRSLSPCASAEGR